MFEKNGEEKASRRKLLSWLRVVYVDKDPQVHCLANSANSASAASIMRESQAHQVVGKVVDLVRY
jgi:hypothetical protein